MRYFVAKMFHGPMLIVADRIDTLFDWCQENRIGWQFDPMYTRMVPAHYLVEIDQIGCPDPAPRYNRFFHPTVETGSTDLDELGARYMGAAYAALASWVNQIPACEPIGVAFSGGIDSTSALLMLRKAILERGDRRRPCARIEQPAVEVVAMILHWSRMHPVAPLRQAAQVRRHAGGARRSLREAFRSSRRTGWRCRGRRDWRLRRSPGDSRRTGSLARRR